MGEYKHIKREFGPVFDSNSDILILGSFPSVKSRAVNFFYGHPQNRFWKVLSAVIERDIPDDTEGKKRILKESHIALWDVIEECDIVGSSDSSIRNIVPVDINSVIENSRIGAVYCNGNKAFSLYKKYLEPLCNITAQVLPSTSPANAAWTIEELTKRWKEILGEKYMAK